MNFINISRKLQTLLEKEELLFTDICKEWSVTDSQEEFLNILENWKWPINGSVKRKMIFRNFKLHRKTSQSVLHLGTSYIILKVSKKNREGKQELLGLRKGEKNTRKEWERYGGKEKGRKEGRKEAVETNVVHSGIFEIKK